MNNKRLLTLPMFLLLLLFFVQVPFAQIVEVPLGHWVYDFLDRMETKGAIKKVRNGTKPFSRLRVAKLLAEIEEAGLTSVERGQLEWLQEEFAFELKKLGEQSEDIRPRRHLLVRREKEGIFFIDPAFRLFSRTKNSPNGTSQERATVITAGGELYGYLGNFIGFYGRHLETQETSPNSKRLERNIPLKGIPFPNRSYIGFAYNEIRVNLSFQFPWFTIETGLSSNIWGPGYRGNLALSDHPPNYGQLKITTHFGDWLDFTNIHGFLQSDVVDSSRSYRSDSGFDRRLFRQKYLAGHRLEISLYPGIDLGLNEAVIYGDRDPEILYLVPGVFFWDAGHYLQDLDNAQMSADLELSLIPKLKFYGAIYIDNITLNRMFDPERHLNFIGLQGGIHLVDPLTSVFTFTENLDLRLEYTRLNPWVYSHKFSVNTYENHGYTLGHWIGQNADDLFLQLSYRPRRSLLLAASYERRRKGDEGDPGEAYRMPAEPFLYGEVERHDLLGLEVTYKPYRDLFLQIGYKLIQSKNHLSPSSGVREDTQEDRLYLGIGYNHYQ